MSNTKTIIQYLSDIHLEIFPYEFKPNPKSDILVLAGDIFTQKQNVNSIFENFLESIIKWGKPCIMIAGNHEYYYGNYNKTKNLLNQLTKNNFFFLDNSCIKLNNIKFIGSTLWSEIDLNKSFEISNYINDYRLIYNNNDIEKRNFSIQDSLYEFYKSKEFIENELKENCKKVVITHHLPSYKSVHYKYKNFVLTSAFASNLDNLILKYSPEIWIHGHSHSSCDYNLGNTKIVSNPRGYASKNNVENKEFIDDKIIEI